VECVLFADHNSVIMTRGKRNDDEQDDADEFYFVIK